MEYLQRFAYFARSGVKIRHDQVLRPRFDGQPLRFVKRAELIGYIGVSGLETVNFPQHRNGFEVKALVTVVIGDA